MVIHRRRFAIYIILAIFVYLYNGLYTSGADIEEWRFSEIFYAAQTAEIVHYEGQVEIQRAGSTEWSPAWIKAELVVGDRIRTSKNSQATLRSADRSDHNVEELTKLTVMAIPEQRRVFVLTPAFRSRQHRSAQNEKDPDPPPASSRWRIP